MVPTTGESKMNAQQITQIAQHLNISSNQVKEVQEWAYVYFVKFTKGSPRFVSKKVVKPVFDLEAEIEAAEKRAEENAAKAEAMAARISDHLSCDPQYENLFSVAVDVLEGYCTFEDAVARFTSKKVILKK